MSANHSHSENSHQRDQQSALSIRILLRAFLATEPDLLQWDEQVFKNNQFGQWKLILFNAKDTLGMLLFFAVVLVLIDSGCRKNYEQLVQK